MLVKEVDFNDFLEEFEKHGRENQFSYEGKKALFNHLKQLSDNIGEPIELLDITGICCEFTEYEDLEEFNNAYGYTIDEVSSIDEIGYRTTVIPIHGEKFIIRDF